jgi:uncharacterized membrane protein
VLRWVKVVTSSRWFHPLLLLFWIAVGAGLRLMRLTAKAPWTDEFSTIVFGLGHTFTTIPLDQALSINDLLQPIQPDPTTGIGDVIHHLLKNSNHPPLYFVLAHLWMGLFPPDDGLVSMWAARSLPALFGILSIPAIFSLGYLAFRSRLVGQMAAAMMAVSPFGIFLAQEARHYTLAILFVIASICCFIIAVQSIHHRTPLPTKVGLTWVIINTLGVATHYFFTLTLGAQALALLAVAWRQVKREGERGRGGARAKSFTQTQGKEQPFPSKLYPATPNPSQEAILESSPTLSPPECVPLRYHPLTSSLPHLDLARTKANPQLLSQPWRRIYLVAAGSLAGSVVWLPILQSNYDYELTHWIYDGDPLKSWLEPIGRVLAWLITTLISLPMELTTLPLGILIASGLVTVIFVLWVLPIVRYGLKREHFPPDTRLNLQVLGHFAIAALVLFFGITYTLGADLTLAPRYQFVYFPVAIALLGAALAMSWDAAIPNVKIEPKLGGHRFSLIRLSRKGGKKAVVLILLMGVLGGLTVNWNLGYLQSIRPDLLVNVIQKVSDSPVLIATTHQHHGHTGRMMGLAWEFKHRHPSNSPESRDINSPQFLLAHAESNSQAKDPEITLQETVAGLPRPLDIWLVNFHSDVDLEQQKCFVTSQPLPKVDSYWYRLYRCPASE